VLAAHVPGFLDHFARQGWITSDGQQWRATLRGVSELRFFAELTRPLLESYFAVFAAALATPMPIGVKALANESREHFERAELVGEVGLAEASNPVAFGNALDWLVEREILELVPGEGTGKARREAHYVRGPAFVQLAPLRDRLAAALAPR
jgi:glycerol-3-phosphate O-acyltransferase